MYYRHAENAVSLNDTRIKALKPKPGRYTVSDGGGLVLDVTVSGPKSLRYRYSLHGKQQPVVTIEKALAHTIKGVYNGAQYTGERWRILRLWAEFVFV